MNYEIKHFPDEHKFVTEVEGETATVVYKLFDKYLDIIYTYVPTSIGGRGVAAALVEAAYTYAKENGMVPQATCSYAVLWLRRHPEFLK
ncbi:GNAT family N-acetyltransferase [Bacteroides sp. 224]|uniref:GNAT family N-acetyltransferase n=1 Tax=Bacteroides sp. 224 TaxID=2302936 RepID=UPI0013D4FE72|nr:GNAT family N-acetyltransferase [Bacteroides sp. 224]NDV66744.1 N-acetyltransferase [Bacteroides sp. 224]